MYKFTLRSMRGLLLAGLFLACGSACFAAPNKLSSAAKGVNTANAPVPTPLLNGKKVFISFDMGDVLVFPTVYSGGPERAYTEFFTDMQQWGHYEQVLNPQDADLIFSIRFVEGGNLAWPQIRLSMSDAKTHVVLWGFVEQVNGAFFKKHRDQAFSNAVMTLVNDIQELLTPGSAKPFPQAADPSKTQFQNQ
ncbi:MAG: hypothetical protein P4K83_11975 [Terracidiphilus sp.]|nr:hypothetical protein [Terracidiphilus sp.]